MANTQTSVPLFVANQILTAAQQNISAGTGVPVFATTVTRDAAFGGSNKALAEGQLCYLESTDVVQQYNGSAWSAVAPVQQIAVFNESQASGTAGGTFTSGSFIKRVLNTSIVNDIVGCSLSSSVITLPAGTFFVNAISPSNNVNKQKTKLRNTTDSTDTLIGTSNYANADVDCSSIVVGVFTIAASKNFELQARCGVTQSGYGLGESSSFGISEVYSSITIVRIA